MKTEICKEKYAGSMCSMVASSEEQNRSLQRELQNQTLSLKQCYVMICDEKVVARAVIDTKRAYIAYLTLEEISQKEADDFVKDIVDHLDRSKEWRIDLYSDKHHHALVYHALKQWFPLEFKRESYTVKTREIAQTSYCFIPAKQLSHKALLELMVAANATTLDVSIQREQQLLGLYPTVQQLANELLEDEESEALFQVLLIEKEAIGFISVTRLLDDIGGIGFIGVHPNVQGRQYSTVLLNKAIDMAWRHNIHKLIGDIDIHNFAIRQNLLRTGFSLDCEQSIFLLEKQFKNCV
ncbi:GNAT family N-acetyltransferase [[Eubacterium] hominis]|uniref:GNAT family N-acetyltransferase n=1 Tax=[Eubacterium] hominis TaxID=2764325 RepID=UPI003A4DE3FF